MRAFQSHWRGNDEADLFTAPSRDWYFAEGYCDGASDTCFLLSNPGFHPARVELSMECEDGYAFVYVCDVPAQRRVTVHADGMPGMARAAFSTRVSSDAPVVAERAMYFAMKR